METDLSGSGSWDQTVLLAARIERDDVSFDEASRQWNIRSNRYVSTFGVFNDVVVGDIGPAGDLNHRYEVGWRDVHGLVGYDAHRVRRSLARAKNNVLNRARTGISVDPDSHGAKLRS
jgi:hypothetical protein